MQNTVDNKVILKTVNEAGSVNSLEFAETHNINHELVKGALNSLNIKNYLELKKEVQDSWVLTTDAKNALTNGTTEYNIWAKLADGPVSQADLAVSF